MTLMHFEVSVLALSISCAHSTLNASNTVKFGYSMILKSYSPITYLFNSTNFSRNYLPNSYTYIVSETR